VDEAGGDLEVLAASEGAVLTLEAVVDLRAAIASAQQLAAPPATDALAEVNEAAMHSRPVLIATQDSTLAESIAAAAKAEGLRPVVVRSVAQALAEVGTGKPALALVDRAFDSGEGAALARRLRWADTSADLPVILVLPNGAPDRAEEAITDTLREPFTEQYLRTRLRAWLLRTHARWERAPEPPDEAERLRALRALGILDTPPEERFDRLTRLAVELFDVPIALVTLVDADRQWFKSRQGDVAPETPRDQAFCAHAILDDEPLVVTNALEDERFAENPLVLGPPHLRFYAGQAIHAPQGSRVGTLCLIDHRPRDLSERERKLLADLAALVEAELKAG
jgi:CheY-like chemotaxis protein